MLILQGQYLIYHFFASSVQHTLQLYVCVLQEALRYYNQTNMQLQMLEFSRQHLVNDDEVSTANLSVTLCI